ncbi:hypothetical protein diail_8155 [Diaporthe ilicicola]|nr:hypothetical protein diail_8155 [Diaporthe ilicicola]
MSAEKLTNTPTIQGSMPVCYEPRVVVKPCAPHRVPHLPVETLYEITKALPQPKSVYNLARVDREPWEYLQPALYECEVTYEERLAHTHGGKSSQTLRKDFGEFLAEHDDSKSDNFASATPVAQKAIRLALVHNPSYLDGVGLMERRYYEVEDDIPRYLIRADLPPPLLLAVAHGNVAVGKVLIEAGADVNLLQGQVAIKRFDMPFWFDGATPVSFKIHRRCLKKRDSFYSDVGCVCQWKDDDSMYNIFGAPGCQTARHVAIRYGQTEMLDMLLQKGLNARLGLHPLIRDAVVEGNVAAVDTLLTHDPSPLHDRQQGSSLMRIVPLMRQRVGKEEVRNGRLRAMVAYPVERGVDLDQKDDDHETVLRATMAYLYGIDPQELAEPGLLIALHAAEVSVSMGAVWDRLDYPDMPECNLLSSCIQETVKLIPLADDPFEVYSVEDRARILYREIRKGYGRVLKAIVKRATRALSQNHSATKGASIQGLPSAGFSLLSSFGPDPEYGPRATEAAALHWDKAKQRRNGELGGEYPGWR